MIKIGIIGGGFMGKMHANCYRALQNVIDVGGNISELGAYYNEDKYWIECLENDKYPERVTSKDAKASLEIVLKEIKSAEIGKEILL